MESREYSKRLCFLVVVVCATVLGLSGGCGRESAPGSKKKEVRLVLNWVAEPEFGGFYAAEQIGAYESRGLKVTIQPGGPGTPTLDMVAAGGAQFGIASADEVVIGRSRGMDVVALFAVYQTCPQGIMVRESSGRQTLASLLGPAKDGKRMTLVVEQGLPYVKHFEKKYGFQHVRVVPFAGGIAQFLADESAAQQCFIFSEPIAARRQGVEPRVLLVAESGYNPYTTVVVTRGEYLREQPRIVSDFIAAVREGWRAYLDDAAAANELMHKFNSTLDLATFAEAAEAQKPLVETEETRTAGLGCMTLARWQTLIEQLIELGVVEAEKAARAEECYVDASVLPGAVQGQP